MGMQQRAPFSWFGGKQALAARIAQLFPPHVIYVEVFGGAGSVLFAKPPSAVEVFNDLDSGVVNFFRVLRDPGQCARLMDLCAMTPYAREEWQDCRAHWPESADPVERARAWFVVVSQAFQGRTGSGGPKREGPGWRYARVASQLPAKTFHNVASRLSQFTARLENVQVEHNDFAQVMTAFDTPETLFYLDPPYLPETRRGGGYTHDMTRADHERLLASLASVQGMVALSGYDAPFYRERLVGWTCHRFAAFCNATWNPGTRERPAAKPRTRRTECVWLSPNCTSAQLQLGFDAGEDAGRGPLVPIPMEEVG